MEYFAGLFDAEGYVTLSKAGGFKIATEMANEEIPNLLQDNFGGNIYVRQRDKRKKTWTWVLASTQECLNFIEQVGSFCQCKATQLLILKKYLENTREIRSTLRDGCIHAISNFKKPLPFMKHEIENSSIEKELSTCFLKWFAGFMDGDGNFCVYEYQGKKSKIFDSWISIFNTFASPIIFVNSVFKGSISQYKGNKFPIWKWVCNQKDSDFVCNSLYPHLRIKKEHCLLVSEFLEIKKTKIREQSYSFDQIDRIRDIIKQIKHLNSL